jgi:sodium transport system ATP-binding protein
MHGGGDMIMVRNLRKRFGRVRAVDGVSFDAPDGAITGLLGANGAGKSTSLGIMAGLMRPDDGTVVCEARDECCPTSSSSRSIGAVLDHQGLYPRLTARENIAYFGALHGLSGARLERRVAETIHLLGLEPFADRRTLGFSQGERTKVALARALVHEPQYLLLDEVANGLDVLSVRAVRELLRRLRGEGRCIVFSSHVLEHVEALCDRLVVIAAGHVVAEGTVDDVRGRTGGATLEEAFVALATAEEDPLWLPA